MLDVSAAFPASVSFFAYGKQSHEIGSSWVSYRLQSCSIQGIVWSKYLHSEHGLCTQSSLLRAMASWRPSDKLLVIIIKSSSCIAHLKRWVLSLDLNCSKRGTVFDYQASFKNEAWPACFLTYQISFARSTEFFTILVNHSRVNPKEWKGLQHKQNNWVFGYQSRLLKKLNLFDLFCSAVEFYYNICLKASF